LGLCLEEYVAVDPVLSKCASMPLTLIRRFKSAAIGDNNRGELIVIRATKAFNNMRDEYSYVRTSDGKFGQVQCILKVEFTEKDDVRFNVKRDVVLLRIFIEHTNKCPVTGFTLLSWAIGQDAYSIYDISSINSLEYIVPSESDQFHRVNPFIV
jgi:hypothetical protein